jgi:ribosomal-protein-alanine N-acetyltransferase
VSETPPATVELRLRPMVAEDLDEVRRLEQIAYGTDAWSRRTLEDELVSGFSDYVVAELMAEAGKGSEHTGFADFRELAGFAGVWFMRDQVHLVTIAVAPERQRLGVASRLLLRCFELAATAEMPSMVLEVRASNEGARALYERFGFRRIGRLRGYYRDDGEDAVVMESWPLDGAEQQAMLAELAARYEVGE